MITRLLRRIIPDDALGGIGFVAWRKTRPSLSGDGYALVASGGICLPVARMYGIESWYDRHGWKPWPTVRDMLPVFSASRGGISYTR